MEPTVLIIDDSPPIHHLALSCFLDERWRISSAYSGVQGLEMAAAISTDLVLLDVDLPDMNGFDVCRHMGVQSNSARSAIIFLTASCSIDERICGLQLGAFDYVTKPFDPVELAERVRSAMRLKRRLDQLPEQSAQRVLNGRTSSLIASACVAESRGAV